MSSPTYRVGDREPLNYLDTSATFDKASGAVFLNVLNRSSKMDISARIENASGQLDAKADVWEMNHPDIKAVHTFGDDRKVRPAMRSANLSLSGNAATYTFPKQSLTILKLRVK